MGVIHVISKYDYDNNTWKIPTNRERYRSLAMGHYIPIINNNSREINYVIIAYGSRVEDNSRDSVNIKERSSHIANVINYFKNNSNSNYIVNFVMLDADAPLIEQSKQLALYIDGLASDTDVKSINLLGQSKCGAMNMYIPRYFNNLRSFSITNIYNVSTPYKGTLLASPLVFYPMVEDLCKSKLGDNAFAKSLYTNLIKLYESISSNSHMDYDIAQPGGIPMDRMDRYDERFIQDIFCGENLYALNHIKSFNNFTTKIDEQTKKRAIKTADVVTIGLCLLDKWFFNQESDGLVKTADQKLIEEYLDVNSVNISSSHRVAVSPDFYKILDCISKNVEKSSQRIR